MTGSVVDLAGTTQSLAVLRLDCLVRKEAEIFCPRTAALDMKRIAWPVSIEFNQRYFLGPLLDGVGDLVEDFSPLAPSIARHAGKILALP